MPRKKGKVWAYSAFYFYYTQNRSTYSHLNFHHCKKKGSKKERRKKKTKTPPWQAMTSVRASTKADVYKKEG